MCKETAVCLDFCVCVPDVLHGDVSAIVLELWVCITVCFIAVDVIQDVLKMAFAVLFALANLIVKAQYSVSLT